MTDRDKPAPDSRFIGRRGVSRFRTLCSDADVTCNASEEDDYGWDMLLEFPRRPQPLVPLDMQEGVISASVQLKATESGARSVALRLSNALHYVRSSLPTFIVLVASENGETRYFAKHVWLPQIAEWLKAARQADADGITATNHEYVTIRFEDGDERGIDIVAWIRDEIRGIAKPYAATKSGIVETIGFGPRLGTGTVNLMLDGVTDFIDFQLGLKPNVRAKSFSFTSERFGIAAGKPEIDLRDVDMIVTPEGQDGMLRFDFPGGPTIAVAGKFFDAEYGGRRAYRIATRCFEWKWDAGEVYVRAHLKPQDVMPAEDVSLFAYLKARATGEQAPMEFETNGRVIPLGSVSFDTDDGQRESWSYCALAISTLRAIAREASQPMRELSFSDANDALRKLQILNALASYGSLRFDFFPRTGVSRRFKCFLARASIELNGQIYAAVATRPIVSDRRSGKRRRIYMGSAKILRAFISPAESWDPALLRDAYSRQLGLLAAEGEILAIGDLEIIANGGEDHVFMVDKPGREVTSSE